MIPMSHMPWTLLESLSQPSKECIIRLGVFELEKPDLSQQPRSKLAAVLVLLYEQAGELRVLLTTRSKLLRAHPGQTALPGGKVDEKDADFVDTAYREAFEEVALPRNSPYVHTICMLEPFLASSRLLVTPIVAFLTNLVVLEQLKGSADEVACIFNHPLQALLDPTLARNEPLVPIGSENWPYETEYYSTTDIHVPSLGMAVYRMHRFRSIASPIKGLTSDILIKVAEIAYAKGTNYERYAPGQVYEFPLICRLLEDNRPAEPEKASTSHITVGNGQAVIA